MVSALDSGSGGPGSAYLRIATTVQETQKENCKSGMDKIM